MAGGSGGKTVRSMVVCLGEERRGEEREGEEKSNNPNLKDGEECHLYSINVTENKQIQLISA